ncbi:hypothetical protein GCM10022226_08840 [Sphaerisporangium flaviroseum]|uniref:Uncharacterized protein n=1 Tax=Sphaerisporangium flaviroseum TaxID=509199 RepID=A0ABP7HG74_9ACTN
MSQLGGGRLVLPEALDALISQTADKELADPVGPLARTRLTCGDVFYVGDTFTACGHGEQASEDRTGSP